jgi:hypothetical protein
LTSILKKIKNQPYISILLRSNIHIKETYRNLKAYSKIKSSKLFNERYYIKNTPNLKNTPMNPIIHYLYYGYKENKNPSEKFNTKYYQNKYKQVKKNGINPLVHYLIWGKKENKYPTKKEEEKSPEKLLKEIKKLKKKVNKYSEIYTIKQINKEKINSEIENFKTYGITKEKRTQKIIVSLTSFPERMYEIHYTLYSLLNQTMKPDEIILWLAEEQFPNLEDDVPIKVKKFKEHGLTIKWTNDIKSYKKLIPTLKEYPNDIIVTADDDAFYPENWLEQLYKEYDGKNIVAHRVREISTDEYNNILPYINWKLIRINNDINLSLNQDSYSSFTNFFTGVGGILYPPHSLHEDVLNQDLFENLSPNTDDIWFWAMALKNNRKIKIVPNGYSKVININPLRRLNLLNERTLWSENSQGGNDIALKNIIEYYPEILEKLKLKIDNGYLNYKLYNGFESKKYWENRYNEGGNSGVGSYNFFAEFKADVINNFVSENKINTVIEFGHGDGNQLKLANYSNYIGFDVSETAVEECRKLFDKDNNKTFKLLREYNNEKADLTLSLDVIFHLIEDNVYEDYMEKLFNSSNKYVIIYSSNSSNVEKERTVTHVKHRKFSTWVEKNRSTWKLIKHIPNKYPYKGDYKTGSFADFFIYKKI